MDTVFEKDTFHKRDGIFYDIKKGVMWHPYGAGFDDRAGVFAILKIIMDGYKPHIIFTTDEEKGGLGAIELACKEPVSPFKELKYIIELDRANKVDCVFYDCYNEKFIDYVESFGFLEAWGSFSDIDIICQEWGIAGVNLSIGYQNEHTCSEILQVNAMYSTIEKVKKMLEDANNAEEFEYILSPYIKEYYPEYYKMYYGDYEVKCNKCGKIFPEYNTIPVKLFDGGTGYYCPDCISNIDKIGWCRTCGEAFERENSDELYCKDCKNKETTWGGMKTKLKIK